MSCSCEFCRERYMGYRSKVIKALLPLLSRWVRLKTPWTAAPQAPLSLGFSRQEHWSGLPFPSAQGVLVVRFCIPLVLSMRRKHWGKGWSGFVSLGFWGVCFSSPKSTQGFFFFFLIRGWLFHSLGLASPTHSVRQPQAHICAIPPEPRLHPLPRATPRGCRGAPGWAAVPIQRLATGCLFHTSLRVCVNTTRLLLHL